MRNLLTSIAVCLALGVCAACGDPPRAPLAVNWTFGTLDCDQVGIATIHVDIGNELLNPSDFSCIDPATGGVTTGANLSAGGNSGFLLGQYQITVIGLDAQGNEVVRGTSTVTVNRGNNVVEVDAGGAVTLLWSFNNGLTCAGASVAFMNVSIDGSFVTNAAGSQNLPCNQAGQDGVQITPLTAGTHVFDLVGFFSDGSVGYAGSISVPVQDGVDSSIAVDLPPAP